MADCTSRDSINYDEYLDAGIPDTLLEGLGFYASSGDAEVSSETDEIPDEKPEPETIEEPQSLTAMSSTTTVAHRRGRPPKSPRFMYMQQPVKAASAPTSVSPLPQTPSVDGAQLSSSKSGDQAAKTIIKGNIVYKRTATGEVIASVIKNGPKPAGSVSVAGASTGRGRPSSESRAAASLFVAGETSMPADCPVNDSNVERVLDESITATQSMRRTLVSLKDDLRRMGGGPAMSATLKPIHLQHRINIAYKLACAFADYRSTISAISSARPASSTVTSSPAVTSAHVPPRPATSISPVVTAVPPVTSVAPVPADICLPPVPVSVFRSVPVTGLSQPSTAGERMQPQQKTARSMAKTVLKQTSTDTMNVVSDDLWMSCDADL